MLNVSQDNTDQVIAPFDPSHITRVTDTGTGQVVIEYKDGTRRIFDKKDVPGQLLARTTIGVDGTSTEGEGAGKNEYTDKIKWGIQEIEVRPEGNGFWGRRIQQSNSRVNDFELKINPNNESYYLEHPNGGYVQFENLVETTVQDGKLIMKQKSFYHVNDMPEFAKVKVLQEAERQVAAAKLAGYNVEWLVSDEKAVWQLTLFFEENNIEIEVIYYPE